MSIRKEPLRMLLKMEDGGSLCCEEKKKISVATGLYSSDYRAEAFVIKVAEKNLTSANLYY
jgi:hypothetical protein